MLNINKAVVLISKVRLDKPADAHAAHGDDAGDLERPAALRAHQTVPRLQAALGTAALRAFSPLCLVFLRLCLPCFNVLFIPHLALTSSHDVFVVVVVFCGL